MLNDRKNCTPSIALVGHCVTFRIQYVLHCQSDNYEVSDAQDYWPTKRPRRRLDSTYFVNPGINHII